MKKGRGGGDLVLESRHLIGLFLLMVVISGVVFTLGYLMGRSQADAQFRAAALREAARPAAGAVAARTPSPQVPAGPQQPSGTGAVPAPSEWDFYRSGEKPKKPPEVKKPGKTVEIAGKQPDPVSNSAKTKPAGQAKALMNPPLVPHGAMVLQVAALTKEGDALAMAEVLQQKKYPAFVLAPSTDKYYRVQVGPYTEQQSAEATRHKLEQEGFKAIVKR